MKIYTKTGDDGVTSLCGPERAPKDDLRIKAYGTVDELSSMLGWCRVMIDDEELDQVALRVQKQLFVLGADLATPGKGVKGKTLRITAEDVTWLEKAVDLYDAQLPTLNQFILPAGSELSCRFHMARVICRRAERRVLSLNHKSKDKPEALQYLNRLSDLLFVLARYANCRIFSVPEESV